MKHRIRELKLWFKRQFWKVKYGFDISETWALDYSLAKWLCKRVKWLSENTNSYPPDYESYEDWIEYLKEIHDGIKYYLDYEKSEEFDFKEEENAYARYQKSMNMFVGRLFNMWD